MAEVKYTERNMVEDEVPKAMDLWRETSMNQGVQSLYTWLEGDPEAFKIAVTDEGQQRPGYTMTEDKTQYLMDAVKNILSKTDSDEPFYIADFSDVVYKIRSWKHKLPRVEPFYAVKCNPDPLLLRLMVAMGLRFDCASKGEIDAVFSAGAEPSDIIYAHPIKASCFLRYAASVRVDLMTFDSEGELQKIKEVFPHARLVLRIEIPNVPAGFPLSRKFGCRMKNTQYLLQIAKDLDLNVIGVSFHVGSLCEQPSAFARAIGMARQVFDFAEDMGFHFTLLDIGGGFPGSTETHDVFDEMCSYIHEALEEHFPHDSEVRIIAEPGCYIVCSAYNLCTKILGRKIQETDTKDNNGYGKKKKVCYYLNDGTFGSFGYGFQKYGFQIKPLLRKSQLANRPVLLSKLWGPTVCSSDCIVDNCLLPELEIGDYIVFSNMGAYTRCLASNFNGFSVPVTHYIFPPQSTYQNNDKLPSYEVFCRELGSNRLKTCIKFQEFVWYDDSNDDLFRKG